MSEIIHDDHVDLWNKIPPNEISNWLTDLDLCMLQANEPDADLHQYRLEHCSNYPVYGNVNQKLFCNIG